jgi:putative colanic acid biosynthesis UDP-glucose lipid carrier transferase
MPNYSLKRAFDIIGSLALLVASTPFFILALILATINSGGSPIFLQKRYGLNCKEFTVYKFRSMKTPPENAAPIDIKPDSDELTWIGRVLRNTCMDELPQLLNVLKGDMSLVGPRPHPAKHAERYAQMDPRYFSRYCVRPGLVCFVQVTNLRFMTETTEHLRARTSSDLEYIKNISLKDDLKILAKAALYVLTLGSYKTKPVEPQNQNNITVAA